MIVSWWCYSVIVKYEAWATCELPLHVAARPRASSHDPIRASRAPSTMTPVSFETFERIHNAEIFFLVASRTFAASHTSPKIRPQMWFSPPPHERRHREDSSHNSRAHHQHLPRRKQSQQPIRDPYGDRFSSRCVDDFVLSGDDASGSGSWKPPLRTLSFLVKLQINGHGVSTRSMPP